MEKQGQLCVSRRPTLAGPQLALRLTHFYRIRLATHLYGEHLLDREHYMDWLVTDVETCPLSKLPMSLLITQIYWKDLLRLRKFGRRLVAALLSHHTSVNRLPSKLPATWLLG